MNATIPDYLKDVTIFSQRISQQYHQKTKIMKMVKQPPPSKWPTEWKKVYFKAYPRLPAIKLSIPKLDPKWSLKQSLYLRQSIREYSDEPLTVEQIGNLLFFSCGIRNTTPTMTGNRFYPSAGARYPLEVYPIIFDAKDLKTGIYHYYLKGHALEELYISPTVKTEVLKNFDAPWMKRAGMIIAISAVFYRNQIKYGERGYRHVLTEVGHMCQNLSLLCPVFDLGSCNSGGFVDDELNKLIDIDGVNESVVSVMFVGNRIK